MFEPFLYKFVLKKKYIQPNVKKIKEKNVFGSLKISKYYF